MDQETGETAQTSVDIEVLQKGQSGKHIGLCMYHVCIQAHEHLEIPL